MSGLSPLADSIKQKLETIRKVFAGASSFTQPGSFVKPQEEIKKPPND
jgi:hypothetical protein